MMSSPPPVRVIVQLPYNRPEQPPNDPPRVHFPCIEWNAEKANILWDVIALSRASDNGGTDWKGLAAHLDVPLPYLLYRAQARYEEDLRGLQDIRGVLSPTNQGVQPTARPVDELSPLGGRRPSIIRRPSSRVANGIGRSSGSTKFSTSLSVRARLNHLGNNSTVHNKDSSSSVLTIQGPKSKTAGYFLPTTLSSSPQDSESEEEEDAKEEETERILEEQEALDRKLKNLQKAITPNALGLITSSTPRLKGKEVDRGRLALPLNKPLHESIRRDDVSVRSNSISTTSSPQGSIPSIPSPPLEPQLQSPAHRNLSSPSPPAVATRNARAQSNFRYGPMVAQTNASEPGSNHGSSASSFSDLSESSLSASALESALLSNIRGGGSRLSAVAKSRLSGRGAGIRQ